MGLPASLLILSPSMGSQSASAIFEAIRRWVLCRVAVAQSFYRRWPAMRRVRSCATTRRPKRCSADNATWLTRLCFERGSGGYMITGRDVLEMFPLVFGRSTPGAAVSHGGDATAARGWATEGIDEMGVDEQLQPGQVSTSEVSWWRRIQSIPDGPRMRMKQRDTAA